MIFLRQAWVLLGRAFNYMKTNLFDSFAGMIDSLPDKRILTAVELEHLMLVEDLLRKRILPNEEADSILHFCQFVKAASEEDNILPVQFPADHLSLYQKILIRLVRAGQLPDEVQAYFDLISSPSSSKSLACNHGR
jgi:hypothetical protein